MADEILYAGHVVKHEQAINPDVSMRIGQIPCLWPEDMVYAVRRTGMGDVVQCVVNAAKCHICCAKSMRDMA